MDAYSKLNEYVGEKKQEHSAAMNISKEEHEMIFKEQTNQGSTVTHGLPHVQGGVLKITKG